MFYILIFLNFIIWNASADVSILENAYPWKLHLSLYSTTQLELAEVDHRSAPTTDPLILAPHIARVIILDDHRLRFELSNPVHVSLHSPRTHELQSEMIFKHFVVQVTEEEIVRLQELQREPFFVFDELSEQRILTFARDVDSGKSLDPQIKYFANALRVPQLRYIEGLRIYLPIENIGTPEGVHSRIMVIGRLHGYLQWFKQAPPKIPLELPLERVFKTFERYDSAITSYFKGLLQMDYRRQNLKRVGWLNALLKKHESAKVQVVNAANIVQLQTKLHCSELF